MMPSPSLLFMGGVLFIALVSDIHFRKIPNLLTFPALAVAVAGHAWYGGLQGLLFSVEGVAAGMALLLLPYTLGGMGAGDVKLMGVVGGLLGPKGVFFAFLYTALAGGAYAFVLLLLQGRLKELAWRLLTVLLAVKGYSAAPPATEKETGAPQLSYGVAIALGAFCSVLRSF